jgi:hypothetical protein
VTARSALSFGLAVGSPALSNICIDLDAASFFESVDLQINGLIFRANPGVASFHVPPQGGL